MLNKLVSIFVFIIAAFLVVWGALMVLNNAFRIAVPLLYMIIAVAIGLAIMYIGISLLKRF